jgi:hypothetical protein
MTKAVDQASQSTSEHGRDEAIARLSAAWKIDRTHVRRLVQRADRYLRVLIAIFEGRSYSEIAASLAVTPREVELTVRYVEDFLAARDFGSPR